MIGWARTCSASGPVVCWSISSDSCFTLFMVGTLPHMKSQCRRWKSYIEYKIDVFIQVKELPELVKCQFIVQNIIIILALKIHHKYVTVWVLIINSAKDIHHMKWYHTEYSYFVFIILYFSDLCKIWNHICNESHLVYFCIFMRCR